MRARGEASSAHVRVLHPLPEPAVLEPRRAMGKKPKGPMTVDALGNAVSVAELEERKAAEEARAAAKARREAKAAAGADAGAAGDAADPSGASGVSAGGDIVSLEDQLKALVLKVRDGQKLTGKEKRAFAKAEKKAVCRASTPTPTPSRTPVRKTHPALSIPESWARALEAVTVHARGGTNDGGGADDEGKNKNASDAVVDVAGLDVSISRRDAAGGGGPARAARRESRAARGERLGKIDARQTRGVRPDQSRDARRRLRRAGARRVRRNLRLREPLRVRRDRRAVTARRVRDHTKNGRRVVR